ncbi:MAG: DUF4340 domain-containing protein [Firmicutes bacterium]|nr:DUF4340 domain-containing protein [Bacillota bacterium]
MNSKKRKEMRQIRTIIISAVVLLLLIVVYFVITNVSTDDDDDDTTETAEGEEGTFTIIDEDYTDMTALSYTYSGETVSMHVSDDGTEWLLDDDESYPLNQETVYYMAAAISDYGGYRRLDYVEDNFSVYGFDDPTYEITATYTDDDGDEYTNHCYVGAENSLTGYYYFWVEDDTYVYMVGDALFEYYSYTLATLFVGEDVPTPDVDDIISLEIEYDGTTYEVDLAVEEETTAEDTSSDDTSSDDTSSDDTSSDEDDGDAPVNVIMSGLQYDIHLTYTYNVAYGVDEDGMVEYGLDDPTATLTLHYYDYVDVDTDDGVSSASIQQEITFVLYFGDTFTVTEETSSDEDTTSEDTSSEEDATSSEDTTTEYIYIAADGSECVYRMLYEDFVTMLAAAGVSFE